MKVDREKTQDELDSEISHDPPGSASTESEPSPAAPEETTDNAAQAEAPLIGDCDTMGTTLKPIC
jgi:hypothetical protein